MAVNRDVRGAGIMRRHFNQTDSAPFRKVNVLGRLVGPVFPFIAGDLDQAVVRAYPDQALRRGEGAIEKTVS